MNITYNYWLDGGVVEKLFFIGVNMVTAGKNALVFCPRPCGFKNKKSKALRGVIFPVDVPFGNFQSHCPL